MSLTARPLLPVTGRSVELELTPDPPFRLEEGKEYTIRCTPLSGFAGIAPAGRWTRRILPVLTGRDRPWLQTAGFGWTCASPRKTNTGCGSATGREKSAVRACTRSSPTFTPAIP